MKFNLTTKQSSKISITPQLQNAIKLLQYSAIEINQEIQNIFESNPLIEKEDACEEYEENSCEEHYSHYKDNPLPNNDNVISTSEVIEKTTSEEDSLKKHLRIHSFLILLLKRALLTASIPIKLNSII